MIVERNPQVKKAVVTFYELSAEERERDRQDRHQRAMWNILSHERWAAKKSKLEIAKNA